MVQEEEAARGLFLLSARRGETEQLLVVANAIVPVRPPPKSNSPGFQIPPTDRQDDSHASSQAGRWCCEGVREKERERGVVDRSVCW